MSYKIGSVYITGGDAFYFLRMPSMKIHSTLHYKNKKFAKSQAHMNKSDQGNTGMNPDTNPTPRKHGRPLSHPENDLRTPQEITWWNENICALAHTRPPLPLAQPKRKYGTHPPDVPIPPGVKLHDAWVFDAVQFLKELALVREMILNIPPLPTNPADQAEYYTFADRSRMQSAVDRIWRLEQDLRFFFGLHREGQRSFARRQAAQKPKALKGKEKIDAGNIVKISKFSA
jgi:hypothetical protein